MKHFLEILRPVNCLMASVAVFIGAYIGGIDWTASLEPLILAMASAFLICSGGMVINDFFDARLDKVEKPHRPSVGSLVRQDRRLLV